MEALAYVSEARVPFGADDLAVLRSQAAEFNATVAVTGYLFHERSRFLQYLEGRTASLEQVYDRVRRDTRHEILGVLTDENLVERRFPGWDMQSLTERDLAEIRLEHLISSELLLRSRRPGLGWDRAVWRMVEAIANAQPGSRSA